MTEKLSEMLSSCIESKNDIDIVKLTQAIAFAGSLESRVELAEGRFKQAEETIRELKADRDDKIREREALISEVKELRTRVDLMKQTIDQGLERAAEGRAAYNLVDKLFSNQVVRRTAMGNVPVTVPGGDTYAGYVGQGDHNVTEVEETA